MEIGIPWKPSLVSIALREFFDIIERRFYEFREREREWGIEVVRNRELKKRFFFFFLEEELERVRKRSSCCCSEQSTQICRSGFLFYFLFYDYADDDDYEKDSLISVHST